MAHGNVIGECGKGTGGRREEAARLKARRGRKKAAVLEQHFYLVLCVRMVSIKELFGWSGLIHSICLSSPAQTTKYLVQSSVVYVACTFSGNHMDGLGESGLWGMPGLELGTPGGRAGGGAD